jgi:hypothetical protein
VGRRGISHYKPNGCFTEREINVRALSLAFENWVNTNNCSKGLEDDRSYMHSPCNTLSKITFYNYIFTLLKWCIPSFQYKMRVDQSTSMREIDDLSHMFQRPHHDSFESRPRCMFPRSYPSSRSVLYIHVLSAKWAKWTPRIWGVSFVYKV